MINKSPKFSFIVQKQIFAENIADAIKNEKKGKIIHAWQEKTENQAHQELTPAFGFMVSPEEEEENE